MKSKKFEDCSVVAKAKCSACSRRCFRTSGASVLAFTRSETLGSSNAYLCEALAIVEPLLASSTRVGTPQVHYHTLPWNEQGSHWLPIVT